MSAEAEEFKAKGSAALKAEKFQEAVNFYGEAIKLDGTNAVYYSNRSAAYARMGKWADALDDANSCINVDENFAKGYSRKGAAHYAKGELPAAKNAYTKAVAKGYAQAQADVAKVEAAMRPKPAYTPPSGGYGYRSPARHPWGDGGASATFGLSNLLRLAVSLAALAFAGLYIARAISELIARGTGAGGPITDNWRHVCFSRAILASVARLILEVHRHYTPCPVDVRKLYSDGLNSQTGNEFNIWMNRFIIEGPAADPFQSIMMTAAFLSGGPVPLALGPVVVYALNAANSELQSLYNRFLPGSISSRTQSIYAWLRGALAAHAPAFVAWLEFATLCYLVMLLLTPNRSIMSLFLFGQGMAYRVKINPHTKVVLGSVDGVVMSVLPGFVKPHYVKVKNMAKSKLQ